MKARFSIEALLAVLVVGSAFGATRLVRSDVWNGKQYSRYVFDDGSSVEIKSTIGEMAVDTLVKANAWKATMDAAKALEAVVAADPPLSQATVEQIKAEVAKRKLTAKDLGLEVSVQEVVK